MFEMQKSKGTLLLMFVMTAHEIFMRSCDSVFTLANDPTGRSIRLRCTHDEATRNHRVDELLRLELGAMEGAQNFVSEHGASSHRASHSLTERFPKKARDLCQVDALRVESIGHAEAYQIERDALGRARMAHGCWTRQIGQGRRMRRPPFEGG